MAQDTKLVSRQDPPVALIVEDDVAMRRLIRRAVEAEGCWVIEVSSGEEAIRAFEQHHPRIVLLDAVIPGLDGFEVCARIKKLPGGAETPVLIVTALDDETSVAAAFDAGATDFVTKPIAWAVLRHRVRKLVETGRAAADLGAAEASLAEARDQALESSRLKSEFMANVSHEIRTPLSQINVLTELLLDTGLSEEQRDFVVSVEEAVRRLRDIVEDILDFSKLETGGLALKHIDFDLPSVIERTVEVLAPRAERKGLALATFVAPDLPTQVRGDPERLRQVLFNLLDNAVKFTERGAVVVRAVPRGARDGDVQVHVTVLDTGIGLTAVARRRLFTPFAQADGSPTRRFEGTGLGLSIAHGLVELMGGTIGVKSRDHLGSTFWFTVPMQVSAAVPPKPSLAGCRVLVADPQAGQRAVLAEYVAAWGAECDEVDAAESIAGAVRLAAERGAPYDVVLVGRLEWPGDGVALLGGDEPARPRLIAVGAMPPGSGRGVAPPNGFDDRLGWPVRREHLRRILEAAVTASSGK